MGLDGESGPETSADATGPDGSTLWYAALGHLIDEVVFIHRADRAIAFVSPSVTEVLGYTPGEFTSMRTPELIHPEDLPMATEQALALRAEPGARYRSILRVRHADGRWLWVEIVGRNLLHEPSVQGIVQTLRDISERRRLEEELEHRASTTTASPGWPTATTSSTSSTPPSPPTPSASPCCTSTSTASRR
ncbi:MAG: PAS domain-containing protein [Acidimicrobiales bacterium]